MSRESIQDEFNSFIEDVKAEDGHHVAYGINDWENHYLSEEWAKTVKILMVVFLGEHRKFIVDFIEKQEETLDVEYDKDNIYDLLSATALYCTMQSAKREARNHNKSATTLPNLKKHLKKQSLAKNKKIAKDKAMELLQYIPATALMPEKLNQTIGYALCNFINNIDDYYEEWEEPSAKNKELKEHLESLLILREESTKYLAHFKA